MQYTLEIGNVWSYACHGAVVSVTTTFASKCLSSPSVPTKGSRHNSAGSSSNCQVIWVGRLSNNSKNRENPLLTNKKDGSYWNTFVRQQANNVCFPGKKTKIYIYIYIYIYILIFIYYINFNFYILIKYLTARRITNVQRNKLKESGSEKETIFKRKL